MKFLSILALLLIYLNVTSIAQGIDSASLQRRLSTLSRIWKVTLSVVPPQKAHSGMNEVTLTEDENTPTPLHKLSDKYFPLIAMVLAECGIVDASVSDTVILSLYNERSPELLRQKYYTISAVLSRYKTMHNKIKSLLELLFIPYNFSYQNGALDVTFHAPYDLYAGPNVYGLATLVYSAIITKCFDGKPREVQTLNITWTDPQGHAHDQTYSTNDSTYLRQEANF